MADDELQKILADHVKALERVMAPRPSRFSDLTTVIAVLGLIVSIGQSWAVTGKRLDDIEKQRAADAVTMAKVPQLEWSVSQINETLKDLRQQGTEQSTALRDMREVLIKLGMQLPPPRK